MRPYAPASDAALELPVEVATAPSSSATGLLGAVGRLLLALEVVGEESIGFEGLLHRGDANSKRVVRLRGGALLDVGARPFLWVVVVILVRVVEHGNLSLPFGLLARGFHLLQGLVVVALGLLARLGGGGLSEDTILQKLFYGCQRLVVVAQCIGSVTLGRHGALGWSSRNEQGTATTKRNEDDSKSIAVSAKCIACILRYQSPATFINPTQKPDVSQGI